MADSNHTTKIKKLAEELVQLTIKEVKALTDILKEKHGIEPMTAVAPVAPAVEEPSKKTKEEKTIFDVTLVSAGTSKLGVIKALKNIMGVSLKEAKDIVDNPPQPIKEKIPREEAEKIQKELVEAGAEVTLN